MKKGVITVYLALTFSVLLSIFISALEAAKISAYRLIAECAVQNGIISAFGEYNRELLKQYDLLFVDLSYQTDKASVNALSDHVGDYIGQNLSEPESRYLYARDFWGSGTAETNVCAVRMASDEFGGVLKNQAVEYVKDEVPVFFIEDLMSLVRIKEEYSLDKESFDKYKSELKEQAEEALNEDKNGKETEDGEETDSSGKKKYSEADELLIKEMTDWDIEIKYLKPIDLLILKKNAKDVSAKIFNPLDMPSMRVANFQKVDKELKENSFDPFENVYFTEYIMRKSGNYVRPKENSYLKYEAEYIFAGQNNESANLSYTIHAIFYIRTVANIISLKNDKEKSEIVQSIGDGLASFTPVPSAVYQGLIYCIWAAGESTFDVEDLLKGEKVSLIKKGSDFNLSVSGGIRNLLADSKREIKSLPDHSGGKNLPAESSLGEYSENFKELSVDIKLSYEDYLRILILTTASDFTTLRLMDVIETDLRQSEGNSHFRIDMCTDAVVFECTVVDSNGILYELKRKYCY